VLAFAARVSAKGGKPLVAIALGPLGIVTRLIGGRYGPPFVYAAAAPGAEAASGQMPAETMAGVYRVRESRATTRVYGILGGAARRSLSPLLHNRAFAARQLTRSTSRCRPRPSSRSWRRLPDLGPRGLSA
jgi:3-dehydroquinate dehydratase/shikimate dehydrogenase